jgi:hypothetical protein
MRILAFLALVFVIWPGAVSACKCAEATPTALRAAFERIALVEVIELGPEFDGHSPIPNVTGRNRYVRVRIIESLTGAWAPEETVEETLRVGDSEFDCSLFRRRGDKFLLLLRAKQSLADWCNTRVPEPALVKALRGTVKAPNPSLNRTPAGGLSPARRSPVSLLR